MASLMGLVGFAIPLPFGILERYLEYSAYSDLLYPPPFGWYEMFIRYLYASVGCSLVFSLAAILNYAPETRLGFVRSLLFVGLSALGGILLAKVVWDNLEFFRLDASRFTVRMFPIYVPVFYTVVHTCIRLFYSGHNNSGHNKQGLDS